MAHRAEKILEKKVNIFFVCRVSPWTMGRVGGARNSNRVMATSLLGYVPGWVRRQRGSAHAGSVGITLESPSTVLGQSADSQDARLS